MEEPMRATSTVFFAIGLGAVAATMLLLDANMPRMLFDPISFVATWVPTAALLLASFGPSGLARAYRTAVRGGDKRALGEALAFFASARRLLAATSVVAALLAAISILAKVSRLDQLGMPLAVALCSILYSGIGILFAVEPFRAAADRRLSELG
jgi:hypothetical protein